MTGLRFLGVIFVVLLWLGSTFTVHDRFNIGILFYGGSAAIGLVILAWLIRRNW